MDNDNVGNTPAADGDNDDDDNDDSMLVLPIL